MSESFNYIAFGDADYVANSDLIEMSRGRMFEYTSTDIEKRLERLEVEALTFLEQLPTFFCSEIDRLNDAYSMIVRYGHIRNSVARRKEVTTTFDVLINFGKIVFTGVDQAQELLGVDKLQLYRTHWAVRDGDARAILAKLALLVPDRAQAVQDQLHSDQTGEVEPPQRTKNILGEANSVESFLQRLYAFPPKEETETFFRGHNDTQYELDSVSVAEKARRSLAVYAEGGASLQGTADSALRRIPR